ncbi:MAG: 50S ribosomal protein L21 [Anaerolineaceae bacterium]|nr:50S ribosomal protein L21 [Anaerolineaceae bacterium]
MKYAIVESGGKQYRAEEGSTIEVDLLPNNEGDEIVLENVYMVSNDDSFSIGTPTVKGAKVVAKIESHFKGPKIIVFKYRPKKHYRVKTGHRQQYTRLSIEAIEMEK